MCVKGEGARVKIFDALMSVHDVKMFFFLAPVKEHRVIKFVTNFIYEGTISSIIPRSCP